jgi:hypothetical protein
VLFIFQQKKRKLTHALYAALSLVLTQVAIVLVGCTALGVASYLEVVAFLPWTTVAFYVFPLLDIPLRVAHAASSVMTLVLVAAEVASPWIAAASHHTLKAAAALQPPLRYALGRGTSIMDSLLADKYGPLDQRLHLFIGGAFVALFVLICMCRRQKPRREPHRGFRVRALE